MLQGIRAVGSSGFQAAVERSTAAQATQAATGEDELRGTFDKFVGEVFYGQMLKSMRQTVGKPAYFHGGKAEEMFTQQLDQVLSTQMTEASAHTLTGPMYRLFTQNRS